MRNTRHGAALSVGPCLGAALARAGRILASASVAALLALARPAAAQLADLSVVMTASADTIMLGGSVTYTVSVTNGGPADASGAALAQTLSTGLSLASASSTHGSCGPLGRVGLENEMGCALGTLRAGATATVTLIVTAISERFVGSISGTARVQSELADPDPTNNVAQVVTAVLMPSVAVSHAGTGYGVVTSSPPGIDCGAICYATFPTATLVTLTATPAADSSFEGWSGAGCDGTGTCTVYVSTALHVTASFRSTAERGSGGGCATGAGGTALALLAAWAAYRRRRAPP